MAYVPQDHQVALHACMYGNMRGPMRAGFDAGHLGGGKWRAVLRGLKAEGRSGALPTHPPFTSDA